ncbi:MAG: AAA family ATPase [Candidatus Korarchaeota archaeon]
MSLELLDLAAKYSQRARELDTSGKYREAIDAYLEAAEVLLKVANTTKNASVRDTCFQRAQQYVQRAEDLKKYIKTKSKEKTTKDESSELENAIADAIVTEKPNVKWEDVANLESAKKALLEAVILPMRRPELFQGARKPWKGILLYGPPGTGKTMLAKAVATESQATFFSVSAATLVSKWLGESEKLVRALFEMARKKAPALVFIDEVDSIATARSSDEVGGERRLKTQMMIEMDGLKDSKGIVVLAATNRPWEIDAAMRRRFEKRIYIPLPEYDARLVLFKIHTKGVELDPSVKFEELANITEGYSGADIALVCREALMEPVRELAATGKIFDSSSKPRPVSMNDFIKALETVKPSVAPEELELYDEWTRKFAVE